MMYIVEWVTRIGKHKWHPIVYSFITSGFWVIYIVSFMGVASIHPSYIDLVDTIAKFYLAILLLVRFNPYVNTLGTSKFDKQLAWQAGLFLFLSSTLVVAFKRQLRQYITSTS
jgi:hypothetical protein